VLDVLLLLLTLALGAALSRVSLCAVAGMQQAVTARNYAGLERLLIATSGAGVSLLLLAGLRPDQVWLPHDAHFHPGIIAGGLLLGLGAMVNGGCYLGSVLYLGTGNLNFLFTLVGIGLGLRAATAWSPLATVATPSLSMAMGPLWLLGLGLFALIIALLMYHQRIKGQWLALLAGLLAGLVYARQPGWSYGSTLEALAQGRLGLAQWRGELSALSLFVGAIGGAVLAGQFQLRRLDALRALRCLCGGAIMGYGAALIPGGNDSLLLWAIPGLTLYGALAFGLMLITIALGFVISEYALRRRPLVR
jgi:toxin CptA